jgi:hypothetical protein
MPRPTSRARLEYGVKLNINRLMQCGAIQPGSHIVCGTTWPHTYDGKLTARFEAAGTPALAPLSRASIGRQNIKPGFRPGFPSANQ